MDQYVTQNRKHTSFRFNVIIMKNELLYSIRDLTGGVNTKQRPNKIGENELQSIVSMDFSANSLRRSQGYTLYGTEPNSDYLGKSIYTHTILTGQELMIKTIGNTIKFLDTVDNTWYKLTDATFTANLRWSFATFNSYLYGNNGTDSWIFWKGSTLTTIVNAITAVSTTIDLTTGKGVFYPNSGTVMIQDEAITYTGKTDDQLTGCTITANHPAGSTVLLKLDSTTYSSLQKAKQIAFFKNRMYMIDSETPTIIRHSKLADNTNPETDLLNFTIAGSGAGDAGFGIAPNQIIALQPTINGNSSAILASFCKDGIIYAFDVTDTASTTVNVYIPLRTMTTYPISKEMVAIVENDTIMTDQFGHIRTLGYGDVNTPLQVQTISTKIEPSLEIMDFTEGQAIYDKRKKYISGKDTNGNIFTFYHDSNYNAWGAYSHWDCLAFTRYNGKLYGLSSTSGNVYELNSGYDANGGNYYSEATTKDIDFNLPLRLKTLLKLRMSGVITNNAVVYFDVFFDNSENPVTFTIRGDNNDIIGLEPNVSSGTIVFGNGVFGGGLPSGVNRKEFNAELRFKTIVPFNKVSFKIRIDDSNVDFEMNDLIAFGKILDVNQWLTAKIIKP